MTSKEVERVRSFWADIGKAAEGMEFAELRAEIDRRYVGIARPDLIPADAVDASGVPAEWVQDDDQGATRVVYYVHGGGFAVNSPETHRELVQRICKASGARALSVGYRLAPEHKFPAYLDDTVTCYQWLLAQGVDASDVAIVGDSAGGGLIFSTMLALRDLGVPLPAAGVSISPWADFTGAGESYITNAATDPICSREATLAQCEVVLGDHDPRDPLASPVFADLRGLPPLLIMTGARETLVSDAQTLAENAKNAGVDVTYEPWEDMDHIWPLFASFLPEGQQAVDRIGAFLRQHVAASGSPAQVR